MMISKIHLGIVLSFLSYTMFAFMDVINKFLFSSLTISFFNYMLWLDVVIIIVFIIIGCCTNKLSLSFLKTTNPTPIFVRSVLSVCNTLCSLLAISYLPLHIFYSLAFMQPLIASLLGIVLYMEKLNFNKIFLIITGFAGILISVEVWNLDHNNLSLLGIFGGLGIAFTGACSGIVVKKYMPNDNVITIGVYNILLSLLVACIYFLFNTNQLLIIKDIKIIFFIVTAGICAGLGMMLFMKSYQKSTIQSIVPLQYTQILWGVLFGYILFNSTPTLYAIIGALLIIISNYLNIVRNNNA